MGICDSESGSEYSSDSVRIAARAQLGIDLISRETLPTVQITKGERYTLLEVYPVTPTTAGEPIRHVRFQVLCDDGETRRVHYTNFRRY